MRDKSLGEIKIKIKTSLSLKPTTLRNKCGRGFKSNKTALLDRNCRAGADDVADSRVWAAVRAWSKRVYSDLYTTSYLDHQDRISADVSGKNRRCSGHTTFVGGGKGKRLFQQSLPTTGKGPAKVFAINFKNMNGLENAKRQVRGKPYACANLLSRRCDPQHARRGRRMIIVARNIDNRIKNIAVHVQRLNIDNFLK